MKSILTTILILMGSVPGITQVQSIFEAKALGAGNEVSVSGVVINGSELGAIRYVQDETGGLAIYDPDKMSAIIEGDSITVSGTLVDYNNLLEIQPVTSVVVEKQGVELPEPALLAPSQLGEEYEGMLVRIDHAFFESAGGTFEAKMNYNISSGGETAEIRISDVASPFVGQVIPSSEATITGVLSHFYDIYQVLVRGSEDIVPSSSINFVSPPVVSNLSTSGFTIELETDIEGTTEMLYGHTADLELGHLQVPGTGIQHSYTISDAAPSRLFYIKPFSVSGEDTAVITTQVYITQSVSGGDMKAYFNRSVNNTVSLGSDAVTLDHAIDDTLISYIDRAQESIDFTIYNFNNQDISNISEALNAAHSRGVEVRVVYDINQTNFGTDELNSAIGKIASPINDYPNYGIMHNKFVVFDALSDDPDLPVVWTGATNFTDGQINVDPNNVIIIQDKSLAMAYRLEFNEMFGSQGAQPDADSSRFGPDKLDDTPHEFIIGGKRVECYFSPSDNTHAKILKTIQSADKDLSIATMLITKSDIAYAIRDRHDAGVSARVLVNDEASCTEPVVTTLREALQENFKVNGEAGIMHHKYMIVDQSDPESDPLLLTGCHNWSSSAQLRNDENTLIIHDQTMANIYYQEFVSRFAAGKLLVDAPVCYPEFVTMSSGSSYRYDVLYNDEIPGPVTVVINQQPSHGSATVETDQTITYVPDSGFNQAIDTLFYKVSMVSNPAISDSSMMVVYVNLPVGVDGKSSDPAFMAYPNPTKGDLKILFHEGFQPGKVILTDLSGRIQYENTRPLVENGVFSINLESFKNGYYIVTVESENGEIRNIAFILQR